MNLRSLGKNKLVAGAVAGAAAQFASGYVPRFGAGLGTVAVGYLMKDQFSQQLGGYQLGAAAVQSTGLVSTSAAGLM